MEPTIKCGQHLAEHADISGSRFHDVNMARCEFNNVNLSQTCLYDINLSDIKVTAVQMGGATFQHSACRPARPASSGRCSSASAT